jgi:glyoxylase-like metal-dependent hydrolase (beta-lactamase superfamily II)/8-oxo-dGTP pyrophosphatase MutT (NUDIX family)
VNKKSATPKDASAIILLNHDKTKVLWARRNPNLRFLGGFHGFPGGKVDDNDALIEVKNCVDNETAKLLACVVREVFEEVGVLLTRGGKKLTKGQRVSLHNDLINEVFPFSEILETWGLWIDAEDFDFWECWTTPEFSPIRFKTRFFRAVCPRKQKPYPAITELQEIEFIEPQKALDLWARSKVLIAPPVLISLQHLAKGFEPQKREDAEFDFTKREKEEISNLSQKSSVSQRLSGNDLNQNGDDDIDYIELNSRLICFPLRTKTLPPATHTNCFIVGRKEFVVIDAASKEREEQAKLFELVDEFIETGGVCKEIIVSHLHPDHFGGETILKNHLLEKFGLDVPISAHKITAESLEQEVKIEKFIEDKQVFALKDSDGKPFQLKALHTPGHARGHLCFYDEEFGFLLSSDNVVGFGTVVIAPPEGNMIDYLASLERMKNLPHLNFLCGSHGSAVFDAKGRIENYIEHRLDREKQILEALENGANTPREIVEKVYIDLNPKLLPLAEKSVEAHLEKIRQENLAEF